VKSCSSISLYDSTKTLPSGHVEDQQVRAGLQPGLELQSPTGSVFYDPSPSRKPAHQQHDQDDLDEDREGIDGEGTAEEFGGILGIGSQKPG